MNKNANLTTAILAFVLITLSTLCAVPVFAQNQPEDDSADFPQEEQRMVFDLYSSNVFIGNVLGTFTDTYIQIDTPEDIVEQIKKLKTPEEVASLLTGKLPADKTKEIPSVGRVRAEPRFFRIDLKIAAEQLVSQKIKKAEIPLPEDDFTFKNKMQINASTDFKPNTSDGSSLIHNTSVSQGAWQGEMRGSFVKNEPYDLNAMNLTHYVGAATYKAGMLTTQGTRFASGQALWGVAAESNTLLLKRSNVVRSTPIEIFIPSRAKVQMFRKGTQLIYSQIMNFGLQEIDTKDFPDGSYEIEIVIAEQDGTVTSETRQFSKSGNVLAGDKPLYNFQAGIIREDLNLTDKFAMQGGMRWKWNNTTELSSKLMLTEGLAAYEAAINGNLSGITYTVTGHLTSTGASAVAGHLRYTRKPWNIILNAEKTFSGHIEAEDATNNERLLSDHLSLYSANINYSHNRFSYQFSATRSSSKGSAEPHYNYGPSVSWNMLSTRKHRLNSSFNYIRSNTGVNSSLIANYTWNINDDWKSRTQVDRNRSSSQDKMKYRQSFNYDKSNGQNSFHAGASRSHIAGNTKSTNDTINMKVTSNHVEWSAAAQQSLDNNGTVISRDADFIASTNHIYTKGKKKDDKSSNIVTPHSRNSSGFIVEFTGNAKGVDMIVLVDGRPKAKAKVGEKAVVNLPPYKTYSLTIKAAEDSALVDHKKESKQITIYPGNIIQTSWNVNKSLLVLGRLINLEGSPIGWKTIKGLNGITATDGAGNFQLEITGNETPYILSKTTKCTFAMPELETEDYFMHVGDVLCL